MDWCSIYSKRHTGFLEFFLFNAVVNGCIHVVSSCPSGTHIFRGGDENRRCWHGGIAFVPVLITNRRNGFCNL